MAVAGLLIAARSVFIGHVTTLLPSLSFLSFALLFYGLPPTLLLCNMAAFRLGGRRDIRCVEITATILGGLVLAWWLARNVSHPRPEFHADGGVTFSYTSTRVRGLLACTVSLGIPALSAWLLLRRTRPPGEMHPLQQLSADRPS